MQKFYGFALLGALIVSVGLNFSQRGEINAQKLEEKLFRCENRLLLDQLREYEYKASSTRTYEEGLTEGLVRSSSVGYTDGYHAAMAQIEQSKYYVAESQKKAVEHEDAVDNASVNALPANDSTSK